MAVELRILELGLTFASYFCDGPMHTIWELYIAGEMEIRIC